jgi:hypothetical protein
MTTKKLYCEITLTIAVAMGPALMAQVQTIVPPPVVGAKPVTVEHIQVHGKALEGNLEGDAVDRDVVVFLPPGYQKDKQPAIRSCMRSTVTRSARSSGLTRSTCRRPLKAGSRRARRR